jgi:CRISPR-associated endonuclease/helicase Cas3
LKNTSAALFSFWGKADRRRDSDCELTTQSPPSFHPLIYHLLDVAACAEALLQEDERLAQLAAACNADKDELSRCFVTLIALHDIGKCARGFQGKVLDLWPNYLGEKPEKELSVRHDAAGVWLFHQNAKLKKIAKELFPELTPAQRLVMIQSVCGHHGQPIEWRPKAEDYPDIGNCKKQIGETAQEAAATIAEEIVRLLQPTPCRIEETTLPDVSFWLAGLSVLSDWLGSNRTWFEFQPPPQSGDLRTGIAHYWETHARPKAKKAMIEAGLLLSSISPATGLTQLFGRQYVATPLQNYAETAALRDGPLLFIIEDMTGAGKTEAAVVLAHRLMLAGKAKGLHIALPTMATANAMFERLAAIYRRLFTGEHPPSIVLTHGRCELFESFTHLPNALAAYGGEAQDEDDPSNIEASAFCADWIARSNKQAFLAQVGAGTIDQAILAVLPARHQSLRLWGLAGKVLIIDEAHAYDAYMNEEIERLLMFHAALGGSAIILSATLPRDKRAKLVKAFRIGTGKEKDQVWQPEKSAYPLVTSVSCDHIDEVPLDLRDSLKREVAVQRIDTIDEVHRRALEAARQGAAVAVIRNTVNEAIESYEILSRAFEDVTLFHARFAMCNRQKIETEVVQRFGKESDRNRNGILVATQVVEQSLDLDFDLLISDLAPVDLLIQRAGRLWRHERGPRPIPGPAFLVLSPEPSDEAGSKWPAPLLPKTNFVYGDAALLWRSAKAIFTAGKIVSCTSQACAAVESGEVRALVEAAYGGDQQPIPSSLEKAELDAMGARSGERTLASFHVLDFQKGYDWDGVKWERDTRIKTRLGEETITFRLARIDDGKIVPWAPVEANDWRRAWALSEVTLRQSQCAGSDNPAELQALVEAVKRYWTLSEKEIPVVVLKEIAEQGVWEASVLDTDCQPTRIFYSSNEGLKLFSHY